MLKRFSCFFAAVSAMILSGFNSAFAAGLIDSSAVTSAQTDALADIGTVSGVVVVVMLALLGFYFAVKALRKGGA